MESGDTGLRKVHSFAVHTKEVLYGTCKNQERGNTDVFYAFDAKRFRENGFDQKREMAVYACGY